MSHASLNRHDIFTLMGASVHEQPTPYPMTLGLDGVGRLDDGTEVIIYPLLNSPDWRDDETLDPQWNVLSELEQGTFAQCVTVPRRNVIVKPKELSSIHAAVLGTAWLTAYRMLFTKAGLQPGQTMLVQGATGGTSTALIQMGKAAGVEVWTTSRTDKGRELATKLGAHKVFKSGETLPKRVDAVMDSVGQSTWAHSLKSVARGGTIVTVGVTTGSDPKSDLLRVFTEVITIKGTIMGTLEELKNLIRFVITSGIEPEIGDVMPLRDARRPIQAMLDGQTYGKTVFTVN
jgi:NADPH:quinone reductase-like Zn-dependent oxidoreductase